MTHYNKGRAAEWRTQRHLESLGYETMRAAGSKGAADIIAWRPGCNDMRYISVKSGVASASPAEREALLLTLPAFAVGEVWMWKPYARHPHITRVGR